MSADINSATATRPKTYMDLPCEIYLMVCAYLSPKDLTRLAVVHRDSYLAVQQPLYDHIGITTWEQLPRLVRTVTSVPTVSRISANDAQLRERDITKLDITLNKATTKKAVSGVDFARCVGAISRRSNNIDMALTIYGPWDTLLGQLSSSSCTLPDVERLVICLGHGDCWDEGSQFAVNVDIWDLCFSGSSLPDLKEVEIDITHSSPDQRPDTLEAAASREITRTSYTSRPPPVESAPFYGLKGMSKISIKHTRRLSVSVLQCLFFSNIIPTKLTHLEIVNCPLLHQLRDHADLAVLLQRGLPLLQHFKLHLNIEDHHHHYSEYCHEIAKHPDTHLCNVVREVGQNIKSLDLALPFVCSRIFTPRTKQAPAVLAERNWPTVPREPYETLCQRLIAEGYRYRRLICWDGICGGGNVWEDMMDLADNQGDNISWEVVSYQDKTASWHVSGCLPMRYKAGDVVERELPQGER